MRPLVLAVIYVAFISLGLPDAVLGAAWPALRHELSFGLDVAGVLAMTTTLGTAFSSFMYAPLLSKWNSGKVVAVSVVATAVAMFGYATAGSLGWLLLCAVPLGLGAGAVDTGLNSYVARHYSARQMTWLHGFWGVGACLGPILMSISIGSQSWRRGFVTIGAIQLLIAALVASSFPFWQQPPGAVARADSTSEAPAVTRWPVLLSTATFLLYSGVEMGMSLWLTSYLLEGRAASPVDSRAMPGLFFLCIAGGRIGTGAIANRLSSRMLIRGGAVLTLVGAVLMWSNLAGTLQLSVVLLGIGCAPLFPALLHETPRLFGTANAQRITGYQVGSFYLGGVTLLPCIGLLARRVSLEMIPVSLVVFALAIFALTESMYTQLGTARARPVPSGAP
jgi:fucose permease